MPAQVTPAKVSAETIAHCKRHSICNGCPLLSSEICNAPVGAQYGTQQWNDYIVRVNTSVAAISKPVYCSSCGSEFQGTGRTDGFSHCENHKGLEATE